MPSERPKNRMPKMHFRHLTLQLLSIVAPLQQTEFFKIQER